VVRQHHLRLPRGLALLSKMLVMAEGLGTELDPEFQLGQVIGPYARRLVAGRYSPEGIVRQLRRAGVDVLDVVAELPVQLRRMRDMLDAGGPEVHLRTAELEPVIDSLEATGRRLEAALLTAALIRTLGDIVPLIRAAEGPGPSRCWQPHWADGGSRRLPCLDVAPTPEKPRRGDENDDPPAIAQVRTHSIATCRRR